MSYDLMFNRAIELHNAGALNQAESIYLQILQVMPENSDVWNLLGLIAQSKGDLIKAQDCFLSAIKYAPTPFFAHFFNLALVYKSLCKPKEAIEALERAVKLNPQLKEGFNLLGVLLIEQKKKTEAVQNFCKALEIDDNFEEARANLLFYTNDFKGLFDLAKNNPDCFEAQFKAGLASSDNKEKEEYFKKAVNLDGQRVEALLTLADILRAQNKINEALTFYYKVLNLDKNNVQAILGVADIYLANHEFEKAEKFYLRSFDITREIAGAHMNYGTLLYEQKRTAEALDEYRLAVQLSPDMPEISYNLSLILKETKDFEEALGLMFNAHLKDKANETYMISLVETLGEFFKIDAEKALKIAENWQKQETDNLFSKRILAALSGVDDKEHDSQYAEKLFDNFANTYEETLSKLNPHIIKKFKELNPQLSGVILDLGCGTGLAAEQLSYSNAQFDGVDISQKMLDEAKKKGIYRHLYKEDILSFLRKHNLKDYDLVIAFDVFCYMGDLKEILEPLKKSSLWFSIESADEEMNKDFYMTSCARYKHKKSYVLRLLEELKFKSVETFELVLRQENGEDVKGVLFKANP